MAKDNPRLLERIIARLGGVTQRQLVDIRHRAYESGYNDHGEDEPTQGDLKKLGYRIASSSQGLRDFSSIDHAKALEIVWGLFQNNPVASRSLEIKAGYIVGSSTKVKIADTVLKEEVIDPFWKDNRVPQRLPQWVKQLYLWGEQCFPVFVRHSDGRVRLGYIDPAEIEEVICHPNNAMERWAVVTREAQQVSNKPWLLALPKRVFRVVRIDEGSYEPLGEPACEFCGVTVDTDSTSCPNCGAPLVRVIAPEHEGMYVIADQASLEPWELVMLESYGREKYDGSCLLAQVNNVSNQPRGWSDFLPVADWMEQHDETLFAVGERERLASFFGWDVTVTGSNQKEVDERGKQIKLHPPRKGTVNVHNEKEIWAFTYPDLKSSSSTEAAKEQLTHVLGGLGLPQHWYGYGDETNRATAQAQGDPTWRTLELDQFDVHSFLVMMLQFVRDQAEIAGTWRSDDDTDDEVDVDMPEMTMRDLATLSSAVSQVVQALADAISKKLMTIETARKIWARVLSELGVPVDASDEELKLNEAESMKQQGVLTEKQPSRGEELGGEATPAFASAPTPAEIGAPPIGAEGV